MTKDELREVYLKQREVYHQMQGKIYPSVMYNDILKTLKAYVSEGGGYGELPHTPSPLADGSVPYFHL